MDRQDLKMLVLLDHRRRGHQAPDKRGLQGHYMLDRQAHRNGARLGYENKDLQGRHTPGRPAQRKWDHRGLSNTALRAPQSLCSYIHRQLRLALRRKTAAAKLLQLPS
jgi:hypothetical protein